MENKGVWGVTNSELESAVAAVDATAFMVPARIVRRVIRKDRELSDSGLRLPHRKTYFLGRESLLRFVEPAEIGIPSAAEVPETVILLARPEPEQLSAITRPRVLLKYWRLLFHARVHVELERSVLEGRLNEQTVDQRIAAIGRLQFEEIRTVLKQENMLLPPVDDTSIYIEFVAVYFELKFFAPRLLADYFPSIDDWSAVEALLEQDFPAKHWFAATRLPGSPEPHEQTVDDEETLVERRADPAATNPRKQSDRLYCRMMNIADRARVNGNDVRSSLMRWWAALRIGPKLARAAREQGREDLRHLAQRLADAIEVVGTQQTAWGDLLEEMLPLAARGIWNSEARFLYDLQKACLDHERGVFHLDVMGWLKSFARRPLKRELKHQREVLIVKHLRGARDRLASLRIPAMRRKQLGDLLEAAVEHAEEELRATLRPYLVEGLDEVGLRAGNRPEEVARKKLVEELLDRVVNRGFFNMGDLRDAVSRNNLKLRDIVHWRELWTGDEALRADTALAVKLEGVYRRGEFYRRVPQWLSSAAFGTTIGRLLTKYGVIPFGGAYMVLAFVQHSLSKKFVEERGVELRSAPLIGLLGCIVIMLYAPTFRAGCWEVLKAIGRLLHDVFVVWPKRLLETDVMRRFMATGAYRALQQFVFKPLVSTIVLGVLLMLMQFRTIGWQGWLGVFVVANLLVNSKWGRAVDEWLGDLGHRSWHHLRIRIFTTVVHAITEFFDEALEAMERMLYAVDEFLRFRTGENRWTTGVKAAVGFVWYFINYLVRFCVTLLVEPQVNPIKHFPVVTVSHKIILPLAPMFTSWLAPTLGQANAWTVVISTIWLIPGVFGYLVWELKENWRLYEANRSTNLKPVVVGSHGESVVRLLRWGFHSGTIPKTYSKLRRADRKALAVGSWDGSRKYRDRLDHMEEDVEHFITREFIEILRMSAHCGPLGLELKHVVLGLNHLQIDIGNDEEAAEPLTLTLREQAGWLTARMTLPAWYERLSVEQARTFMSAVSGFYKMCGVEFVHEQIEQCFAPDVPRYDFCDQGLLVWPLGADLPVLYDMTRPTEPSQLVSPAEPCSLPTLDRQRLFFAAAPIRWAQWVDMWERESRRLDDDAQLRGPARPWGTTLEAS
ncbi:MAG: hypothetical protein JNK76_15560 [Planctomycetales bacterium]|nr:hypothetical protein [Planctomycetales bacterium]MBN8625505.1 hypothetical protein [Planctomycetota bacterium]